VLKPPYQQPVAAAVFWALFVLFVLAEYVVRFRARRNRVGRPAERWSLAVVVATIAGALLVAVRLARWDATRIEAGRWFFFVLGLVLMATGTVIRQWAIAVLGRFFTVEVRVQPGQTVVDRGPYRWVRHPAYTGMIVFLVGVGFALTNWLSLIVLAVVPTAGLVVRIRSEESVLFAALGDDYRRYAAGRRRLFPGVW
jgi:protein-S-isoprenylcysteine O-methyltransferase Ste14